MAADASFPNQVFPWKIILLLATDAVSPFLWRHRHHLFIFKQMSAKYTNLNNQNLSVIVFPIKSGIWWKKQIVQNASQAMVCFSLIQLSFRMQQKWFIYITLSCIIWKGNMLSIYASGVKMRLDLASYLD